MMSNHLASILTAGIVALCLHGHAQAASLRVAPISLQITAEQPITTVRVWNDDRVAIGIQVRIFSWRVVDGRDILEPTSDIVVSPPLTTLAPDGESIIRVVRTSTAPLRAAETYRLLIDQLPNAKQRAGTVDVLVRHAIPVKVSP